MKIIAITVVACIAVAWLVFGGTLQPGMLVTPDKAFISAGQAFVDAVSRLLFS